MHTNRHPFTMFSLTLAILVVGLACNMSVTTDRAQITVGEPSADEQAQAAPINAPALPTETLVPQPEPITPTPEPVDLTPTATLVIEQPALTEPDSPSEAQPPAEDPVPPTPEPAQETPPDSVEPAPDTSVVEQSQPAATEPDSPPENTAPVEPLVLPSLDPRGGGLAGAQTFRQKMTIKFTADGSDYSGVYLYESEVNLAESAVHITVSTEGQVSSALPSNSAEAIWIGNQLWLKIGNQPWLLVPESVAEAQFDEQMFSADDILPYAPPAQKIDPDETVNGVLAHHYAYNLKDWPLEYGTITGSGDIYTAVDGGYVTRYTLNGYGSFSNYFSGNGTLAVMYDTYDVGASISISAPRRR